jgi:hypothetical protein
MYILNGPSLTTNKLVITVDTLTLNLTVTNLKDGRYMIAELDGDAEYQRVVFHSLDKREIKRELEYLLAGNLLNEELTHMQLAEIAIAISNMKF